MQKYDELGADALLTSYGFAPAKVYRVADHGRQYDSSNANARSETKLKTNAPPARAAVAATDTQ